MKSNTPLAPAILLLVSFAVAVAVVIRECPAWGSLAQDIHRAAPHLTHDQAATWAEDIKAADAEAGIGDPWLLAAMVMRESSFLDEVADGERLGSRGEIGCLQLYPGGVALTYRPGCLTGRVCWLRAGALYLATVRERCPGTPWRWVAAYSRRHCPSEETARESQTGRRTLEWYRVMGGESW